MKNAPMRYTVIFAQVFKNYENFIEKILILIFMLKTLIVGTS